MYHISKPDYDIFKGSTFISSVISRFYNGLMNRVRTTCEKIFRNSFNIRNHVYTRRNELNMRKKGEFFTHSRTRKYIINISIYKIFV